MCAANSCALITKRKDGSVEVSVVKHETRTETELFAEGILGNIQNWTLYPHSGCSLLLISTCRQKHVEAKLAISAASCTLFFHCDHLNKQADFKHLHVFVDSAEIMWNLWTNQRIDFSVGVHPDLLHMHTAGVSLPDATGCRGRDCWYLLSSDENGPICLDRIWIL